MLHIVDRFVGSIQPVLQEYGDRPRGTERRGAVVDHRHSADE
jgi:hypothetical protein